MNLLCIYMYTCACACARTGCAWAFAHACSCAPRRFCVLACLMLCAFKVTYVAGLKQMNNCSFNTTQGEAVPFSVQAVFVEGSCKTMSYADMPTMPTTRLFNVCQHKFPCTNTNIHTHVCENAASFSLLRGCRTFSLINYYFGSAQKEVHTLRAHQ